MPNEKNRIYPKEVNLFDLLDCCTEDPELLACAADEINTPLWDAVWKNNLLNLVCLRKPVSLYPHAALTSFQLIFGWFCWNRYLASYEERYFRSALNAKNIAGLLTVHLVKAQSLIDSKIAISQLKSTLRNVMEIEKFYGTLGYLLFAEYFRLIGAMVESQNNQKLALRFYLIAYSWVQQALDRAEHFSNESNNLCAIVGPPVLEYMLQIMPLDKPKLNLYANEFAMFCRSKAMQFAEQQKDAQQSSFTRQFQSFN